ncbi:hypothetical protein Kpol_2001p18 [Vanderwaltozyma polyspora DSM 70294]|uniref:Vacuolar protein sorting-associated protein 35 n=1 Tax=Vanderwaltozyma polyspora (strain ATCC 22028 / DSM 70294 / BCRC 21397 / CBS 2163 / NBRC 10782 / NRRL Y-8283 / UCD 57-17) TaxID=436907 RepID=A7TGQ4_VANPO|nr:uncharacterized protein Kpol_2001p18 [Vanderwaltozyma polyspora DSM 70294]EDO18517.1 hypothetical protein Kpol_2001p18 [Vanderwaltozyma polyspora DSM 70294]
MEVSMDETITLIRQESILLQRLLERDNLIQAINHAVKAISFLRSDDYKLNEYYEIYLLIQDRCFKPLSDYLIKGHTSNKFHLNDVYDTVQYVGNVLPRLYLLVVVGTCYASIDDAPTSEILKDLVEMCRGVQSSIRGMFLRQYLSDNILPFFIDSKYSGRVDQLTKCQLTLENFKEMNKLWIRLQYQGFLKERIQHVEDRIDIKIMVGSQLINIHRIIGDSNLQFYKEKVVPVVLQQIIQCNDVLSQNYLFDVFFQVFPVGYHLATLKSVLEATLHLHHEVSIHEIINLLINKVSSDNVDKIDSLEFVEVFSDYLYNLNQKDPQLSLLQFIPLLESVINLSVNEEKVIALDQFFELLSTKLKNKHTEYINEENETLAKFLILNRIPNVQNYKKFIVKVILESKWYRTLFTDQISGIQAFSVNVILQELLSCSKSEIPIKNKEELQVILSFFSPTIENYDSRHPILQENLVKLVHWILNSMKLKTVNDNIELISILKNWYSNINVDFIHISHLAIITKYWELVKKCKMIQNKYCKNESVKKQYGDSTRQVFKLISRAIQDLVYLNNEQIMTTSHNLCLETATLADSLSLGDISYDFFVQAIEMHEENKISSSQKYTAIVVLIQTLQRTNSLFVENKYNDLIFRCTTMASRLLKKKEQARAVYLCSHLWWTTKTVGMKIVQGEIVDGNTSSNDMAKSMRDRKRVLECLQRSLRVADSILDNITSYQLMIEILEICLFFINGTDGWDSPVPATYIDGLIKLINNNLKSLKLEESTNLKFTGESDEEPLEKEEFVATQDGRYTSFDASIPIDPNKMTRVPINHFTRINDYIKRLQSVDARFKSIKL